MRIVPARYKAEKGRNLSPERLIEQSEQDINTKQERISGERFPDNTLELCDNCHWCCTCVDIKGLIGQCPLCGVQFFHDVADLPYQPLPEHSLEQSPCYPIIGKNQKLYFCRLHPEVKNVNLDPIEHHCKYKDPDYHKSEILNLLSTRSSDNELAA
jgi:hypothetical protein